MKNPLLEKGGKTAGPSGGFQARGGKTTEEGAKRMVVDATRGNGQSCRRARPEVWSPFRREDQKEE